MMTLKLDNANSWAFYQSIYDVTMLEVEKYFSDIGMKKFSFVRIYEGGKYFLFSNEKKFSKRITSNMHEHPSFLMKHIQTIPPEKHSFCILPKNTDDAGLNLLYRLGWSNSFVLYCRHKDYVEALSFALDPNDASCNDFVSKNTILLMNIYWLVREKISAIVPYDQPGILNQVVNGSDITYQPLSAPFSLLDQTQKSPDLLEELSHKRKARFTTQAINILHMQQLYQNSTPNLINPTPLTPGPIR